MIRLPPISTRTDTLCLYTTLCRSFGGQGRNRRWVRSASCFVLGATLGGATLGLGAAGLAAGVAALDLSGEALVGIAAVLAAVSLASDLNLGGLDRKSTRLNSSH